MKSSDDNPVAENLPLQRSPKAVFNDGDAVIITPIADGLPAINSGNAEIAVQDKSVRFQLIPVSDSPSRHAVGEVLERRLGEGRMMHMGRQVVKDGQIMVKDLKKPTEVDAWFTSKVVSRLHAEMWVKESTVRLLTQLYIKDVGSSSGTFLNKMRLSPCGKVSRPYPIKEGDIIQLGVDYKGKTEGQVTNKTFTVQ
jgi:pSer/pThr/pTyr-binding forkhead associated (FHA) protein